ncbi:histidine kinase [Streptomyces sp. RFCAC02]|uniref:sensor histidine kinase n=1 Tax=Streptomyces sp. RFCAC02 TaxID=2499143 RepID=UPI00101F118C|nr:histidine kinase [Streptomyces sp. RFCAC02]
MRRTHRQDRITDALCVVLALCLGAALAAEAVDSGRQGPPWYVLLCLALTMGSCVVLWWRRGRPVAVAVPVVVASAVTDWGAGAVLVAVFTVAVHRPWRQAAAVFCGAVAASGVFGALRPDPALTAEGLGVAGQVVAVVLVTAVATTPFAAWGMVVRARREVVDSLRDRAERAEAEAALRAEQIRGREREHIAREMHDVLAHRITLLSLHAGALEVRPDMAREQVAAVAGTIRASAHQALEDLREILGVLRAGPDTAVRPQPGVGEIAALVAEAVAAGAPVALEDRLPAGAAPAPAVGRTAYRVVQEGLTNARKHAPGCRADVLLDRSADGRLLVRVTNPLADPGAPVSVPGGQAGLVGLGERVRLAGGRLEHGVHRHPGGGVVFRLEAWLPWTE